jgi:thiamine-monophosphate kinase
MKEREIIEAIAGSLPRSPGQVNSLFSSDAEIIEMDGHRLAVTVDDYSAEDRLDARDAKLLGWNLVVATVSDLLAVGAQPRFMLNSLVTSPAMGPAYLHALSAGMHEALEACGASMAGGDIGTGADWRFTGVALGTFAAGRVPLSRVLSREVPVGGITGAVLVTGALGDANLAAGTGGAAPRFELRLAESAALAAQGASPAGVAPLACIDTSDGLASGIETLAGLNPTLRIEIDLAEVPYAPGVIDTAVAMRVPPAAFLMGSAGEYELLALVPDRIAGAIAALEHTGLHRIGTFTTESKPGIYFLSAGRCVALPELPDPREAGSFDAYCANLIELAQRVFGATGRP